MHFRSTIAAVALACLATAGSAQKNLDIFLLIGQSNMAGRGPMTRADSTTDIQGVRLLKDTSGWETARNPLNRFSTIEYGDPKNKIGPGFGFATEMRRLAPAMDLGLVVNARGGTSLSQWVKGGRFYADAIARTRYAMRSGTLKGILWHQGEADKDDTAYVTRLKGFIDSLRKDFGRPDLPFIAGQLGSWSAKFEGFNGRIPKLVSRVAHTAVVRSDSLNHLGDGTHFDRAGQIKLGTRYAAAAWTLIYKDGTVTLAPPRAASGRFPEGSPLIDVLGRAGGGPDAGFPLFPALSSAR